MMIEITRYGSGAIGEFQNDAELLRWINSRMSKVSFSKKDRRVFVSISGTDDIQRLEWALKDKGVAIADDGEKGCLTLCEGD